MMFFCVLLLLTFIIPLYNSRSSLFLQNLKKSFKSLILSIASFELKSDFFGFVISSISESLSSLFSAFEIELIISISDKSQARYTFFFFKQIRQSNKKAKLGDKQTTSLIIKLIE
ncbi:hypothetical protein BpHYR1_033002 [Brachionus plicatilis]|uniref:Uncharacterized protein n=1 Tax=Brachionus plicatilis TaxID=10195 RepID=A0A3M7P6E0_BRAPC|nr:hypothetical protein BpHYR1_033002 [Brachionus plicatilis]